MNTLRNDYKDFNKLKWVEFLASHPKGNIFHSPEIVAFYDSSSKREPIVIASFDELNDFTGILVGEIQREYNGILGKLTARAIVMGGPLVKDNNPEIAKLIIKEFDKVCQNKVVFSQFRNLWATDDLKAAFSSSNYVYEDHLNFIFDLTQSENDLWKNVHPTRRKQINRGLKREIIPSIQDKLTSEEFDKCIEILNLVYKEAKLPCPSKDYFENSLKVLSQGGILKMAIAKFQQQIVGFRFFLCYGNMIYDWYAGSLPEHHDKYPNDILPWEVIRWGVEEQYQIFDFGGAGKPGIPYGVRDYKMKFGGNLVNFGRFEKVHKPLIYKLAKAGFSLWKFLKFY
jgi:serine/alanine adding enzyme